MCCLAMGGSKRPGITAAAKDDTWSAITCDMEGFDPVKWTTQELQMKKETKTKVRATSGFMQNEYAKNCLPIFLLFIAQDHQCAWNLLHNTCRSKCNAIFQSHIKFIFLQSENLNMKFIIL